MRLLSRIVRHWYLYLLILLALPTAATLYGRQKLTSYSSRSYIFVSPPEYLKSLTSGTYLSYLTPAQNEANAMNELLLSESFVVKVASGTDLASLYNLSSSADRSAVFARVRMATSVSASNVGPSGLTLVVNEYSPQLAQQVATALIKQFVADYTTRQLALDDQAEAFYMQQLEQAQAKITADTKAVSDYLTAHPELRGQVTILDPRFQELQQQYNQDLDTQRAIKGTLDSIRLDRAQAKSGNTTISVLDPPSLPLQPELDTKKLLIYYLGGGLAAALALIGLIAGALTFFDRRIYTLEDVQAAMAEAGMSGSHVESVPVLGGAGAANGSRPGAPPLSQMFLPAPSTAPQLAATTAVDVAASPATEEGA